MIKAMGGQFVASCSFASPTFCLHHSAAVVVVVDVSRHLIFYGCHDNRNWPLIINGKIYCTWYPCSWMVIYSKSCMLLPGTQVYSLSLYLHYSYTHENFIPSASIQLQLLLYLVDRVCNAVIISEKYNLGEIRNTGSLIIHVMHIPSGTSVIVRRISRIVSWSSSPAFPLFEASLIPRLSTPAIIVTGFVVDCLVMIVGFVSLPDGVACGVWLGVTCVNAKIIFFVDLFIIALSEKHDTEYF